MLCSNGCGCDIGVRDGRIVGVRGRAVDVVNKGRLGPKGLNGWAANGSADRLTRPLIRRGGRLRARHVDEQDAGRHAEARAQEAVAEAPAEGARLGAGVRQRGPERAPDRGTHHGPDERLGQPGVLAARLAEGAAPAREEAGETDGDRVTVLTAERYRAMRGDRATGEPATGEAATGDETIPPAA